MVFIISDVINVILEYIASYLTGIHMVPYIAFTHEDDDDDT